MTNAHVDLPSLPEIIAEGMSVTEAIQFSRWMLEHPERASLTSEYFRSLLREVVEARTEQNKREWRQIYSGD
jgi:hypothetical protein